MPQPSSKFEISKEDVNRLPLWRYDERIELLETEYDFIAAGDRMSASPEIGIDTETRPAFRKGQVFKVALIQLALPDVVYLLRLNQHGLPDPIRHVLENPTIAKIGIAQKDDVRELKRDFDCALSNVTDLNILCKKIGYKSIGARKLVALIMEKRISKGQQTSNWECPKLTDRQMEYAATDAWVCLEMHNILRERGMLPEGK